jgi:hypothetical protein
VCDPEEAGLTLGPEQPLLQDSRGWGGREWRVGSEAWPKIPYLAGPVCQITSLFSSGKWAQVPEQQESGGRY